MQMLVDGARSDNQQIDIDIDQQLLSDASTADISEDQLTSQQNQLFTMPQAEQEVFNFLTKCVWNNLLSDANLFWPGPLCHLSLI